MRAGKHNWQKEIFLGKIYILEVKCDWVDIKECGWNIFYGLYYITYRGTKMNAAKCLKLINISNQPRHIPVPFMAFMVDLLTIIQVESICCISIIVSQIISRIYIFQCNSNNRNDDDDGRKSFEVRKLHLQSILN